MKTYTAILFLGLLAGLCYPLDWSAKWIWQNDSGPADTWMCFRKSFTLSSAPGTATAYIAADSRYFLYVNDSLIVREGGLKRQGAKIGAYYDEVDLAPYLLSGGNTVAVLVCYWGRPSGSNYSTGMGGLLFQLETPEKTVVSDNSWKALKHPSFSHNTTQHDQGAEWSVYFDASKEMTGWFKRDFIDSAFISAAEKGAPPCAPWDTLKQRPIPMWKHASPVFQSNFTPVTGPATVYIELPYNMQFYPVFKVKGSYSGQFLRVNSATNASANLVTDYVLRGDGDEEYFESPVWTTGWRIRFQVPPKTTLLAMGYIETGYDADYTVGFQSNLPDMNRMWRMAQRTAHICMKDQYMDCPDRERNPWTGDGLTVIQNVSLYSLDRRADLLTAKGFRELAYLSECQGLPVIMPAQSLAALGLWGLHAYLMHSGDSALIREIYPRIKTYLSRYRPLQADGGVDMNDFADSFGGWFDWGGGIIDRRLLGTIWYYAAIKAACHYAFVAGQSADTATFNEDIRAIESNFNPTFWDSVAQCYRDPGCASCRDDRANGLAVAAGLADTARWPALVSLLNTTYTAGPWMERWVLDALFTMGEGQAALRRIRTQYGAMLATPDLTTLYEQFPKQGSCNHGWSGGPLIMMSQYVAGIAPETPGFGVYHVLPQVDDSFRVTDAVVVSVKGDIRVRAGRDNGQVVLDLVSPAGTEAIVGIPRTGNVFASILANGTEVWNNGVYTGSVAGLVAGTQDGRFIRFRVQPGTWRFIADGSSPLVSVVASAPESVEQYDTATITATAHYASGNTETAGFTFTSLDTFAAAVSAAGLVTARNIGVARIRVEKKGVADTVSVNVTATTATLDSIRMSLSETKVLEGDNKPLSATGYFHQGQTVFQANLDSLAAWTSGDDAVASVARGLVSGVSAGGPIPITAAKDGKQAVCLLTVVHRPVTLFRINFQVKAYPPAKAGWLVDNSEPLSPGYGWISSTSRFSRRDDRFYSSNPLFQTLVTTGGDTASYRIWVPDGRYITRIGMGDADYGTAFVNFVAMGADTLVRVGPGTRVIGVGVDTVEALGDSGLNLRIFGTICYMVIMSDDVTDPDFVADDGYVSPGGTTAEERAENSPVIELALSANPNPFNPRVTISYALTPNQTAEYRVCNMRGQIVFSAKLESGPMGKKGVLAWDGKDGQGKALASGLYLGRLLAADGRALTGKLLMLK